MLRISEIRLRSIFYVIIFHEKLHLTNMRASAIKIQSFCRLKWTICQVNSKQHFDDSKNFNGELRTTKNEICSCLFQYHSDTLSSRASNERMMMIQLN